MSSCSDKDQVEVPKAVSPGAGETVKVGKLCLQNYKNKDEVHVHDDEKKLCFIQSKRAFQLAMDNFLKVHHDMPMTVTCVFPGKGADLVLELEENNWVMKVVKKNSVKGPIFGDSIVTILDEFCQRL